MRSRPARSPVPTATSIIRAGCNPVDAEKRGIKHDDIVSIYNERGTVLAGAYVTERIMPGVIYIDHGAKWDPIDPGVIDRGGAINTIVPTQHNIEKSRRARRQRLPGRGRKD